MQRRRPDCRHAEVPGRGHIPFLDEPEAVECILHWLDDIRSLPDAVQPSKPAPADTPDPST
jgi:hypothetical protein